MFADSCAAGRTCRRVAKAAPKCTWLAIEGNCICVCVRADMFVLIRVRVCAFTSIANFHVVAHTNTAIHINVLAC